MLSLVKFEVGVRAAVFHQDNSIFKQSFCPGKTCIRLSETQQHMLPLVNSKKRAKYHIL